jgi:predicted Zn-dependent protease
VAVLDSLERLDALETESGRWAVRLARAYRSKGLYAKAGAAIDRAIQREPYRAAFRELAAGIAIQADEVDEAIHHIEALTMVEPDRWIHWTRLAAVRARAGDADGAHTAALRARELNAAAPVSAFLRDMPDERAN